MNRVTFHRPWINSLRRIFLCMFLGIMEKADYWQNSSRVLETKSKWIKMQKKRNTRVNGYLDKVKTTINKDRFAASAYTHGIYCKTKHNSINVFSCVIKWNEPLDKVTCSVTIKAGHCWWHKLCDPLIVVDDFSSERFTLRCGKRTNLVFESFVQILKKRRVEAIKKIKTGSKFACIFLQKDLFALYFKRDWPCIYWWYWLRISFFLKRRRLLNRGSLKFETRNAVFA